MPALKAKYSDKSKIPAALVEFYTEVDGEFVLETPEGMASKDKLDEFRKTNSAILKALGIKDVTDLKDVVAKLEKLKDVDPDLYATLKKEHEDAEATKLTSKGKYEQALEAQRKTMQAEFDKTNGEKDQKIVALTTRLETVLIDEAAATAGALKGVRPTALDDLKSRARRVFKLDGDNIKAFDGEKEKFGKAGGTLAIGEWIETLLTDAPHLFDASEGTNARGGSGGGGTGEYNASNNPFSTATLNRTVQARLLRDNPTLAKTLQQSAKV